MTKKNIIVILIISLVALAIFLTVCGVKGVFGGSLSPKDTFRFICDGFFVAGIVELGIAGLIWASDNGAFDGIRFGVTNLFRLHFSTKRLDWKEKESFSEYKERIHKKKDNKPLIVLAIVGAVFLVLAVIMLIVYMKAKQFTN